MFKPLSKRVRSGHIYRHLGKKEKIQGTPSEGEGFNPRKGTGACCLKIGAIIESARSHPRRVMIYNSVTRLLGVPYAEAFKVFCTETAFLEMGMDYALRRTQEVLERVEAA